MNPWFPKLRDAIIFFVGAILGSLFFSQFHLHKAVDEEVRTGGYTFINPLLECSAAEGAVEDLSSVKKEVRNTISELMDAKKVSLVSIYYRDLNNGPWFGINENENFYPASLLKVPVMISTYKAAEINPSFLNEEIEYQGSSYNVEQIIKPREELTKGKTYRVEDLIEHMIKYSDNNAALVLLQLLPKDAVAQTYISLGQPAPHVDNSRDDFMSVRTYSTFFRILFNASYLSRELSEQALKLLSTIDFKDGLVKGVPSDVAVSHKFGEREDGNVIQLHDCGIVYYPKKPYLLCVMTRGDNMTNLSDSIAAISKAVYDERAKRVE